MAATSIKRAGKVKEPAARLIETAPFSGKQTLAASCDTSVAVLKSYRSTDGVMLSWEAAGKYGGFRISRDGKVIADDIAADARSFEDKQAPAGGKVTYSIVPTGGEVTPATLVVNRDPADSGGALVYEPFDYPASPDVPQPLTGVGSARGTKGSYVYLSEEHPDRVPVTLAKGLGYGALPVTGNRGGTHRWGKDAYIELDGSLKEAGLLEDGATLWMSYVFAAGEEQTHRNGGGIVTLRSEDMQEGVGFKADGRQHETAVVVGGKDHLGKRRGERQLRAFPDDRPRPQASGKGGSRFRPLQHRPDQTQPAGHRRRRTVRRNTRRPDLRVGDRRRQVAALASTPNGVPPTHIEKVQIRSPRTPPRS